MKHALAGLVITLVAASSWAQGPPEFVVRGALKGAETPEFYQYQVLFQFAHEALADPDPEFRSYYVKEVVGLPPGGEAEELFAAAVADAWEVMRAGHEPEVSMEVEGHGESTLTTEVETGIERDDFESDEAYDAAIRRHELGQARDLGHILGRLEASLEARGVSVEGLHRYATERLASKSSLISSEEIGPDHQIRQVEHSFEVGREAGRRSGGAR